ncbi:MAG: hypothetical protein JXA09_09715 [Anaerolineae bacterium]|nr:hypothetical protein [Anaerolineae bacterium]
MNRYIRWQALLTVLGITLVAAVLVYIAPRPERAPPTVTVETTVVPVRGGTYVEGMAGYPHLINPLFSHLNDADRDLCALIFEGLTTVNERNEVVPMLAEEWFVSADGLTYTFHLRDSVRWQDGEPLTSRDVAFTVSLLQSDQLAFPSPYADLWRSIVVVDADPYVVKFRLLEPYAPFLDYTTFGILPEHILADVPVEELHAHAFNYAPVGSGLFGVDPAASTSDQLTLVASPYHRLWARTMLDRIQFRFYPTYEHALAAYEAGDVMGVSHILAEDLPRARAQRALQLFSAHMSGLNMVLLNLNNQDAVFFQDQRVRQALLYGLDRSGLVEQVLGGQGRVLHSPIMPQSWAYDPGVETYAYAPERAVALLEEAGWLLPEQTRSTFGDLEAEEAEVRVKQGVRLEFTLLTTDVPDRVALAHAIADQWAELGVRVQVEQLSMTALTQDRLHPRAFEAALVQWQVRTDPDPYPLWHSTQAAVGGQNYGGWVDRDADEAIEVARLMVDQARRAELYRQFQEIFVEQAPAILLYQPVYTYGVDAAVRNVQVAPMPDPSGRFRTVSQWAVLEEEVVLADLNDQVGDKLDKRTDP